MVELLVTLVVVVMAGAAEALHAVRSRRVASLAFGPGRQPRVWARTAPWLRIASLGLLAWGLTTLLLIEAKVHRARTNEQEKEKHLVIVLDVSPSMRLQDAGPDGSESRRRRCFSIMESFFKRISLSRYGISVIALYNGAIPVVVDTNDIEVVRNILDDLPLQFAFKSGKTNLFAGIEEAFKIARPWPPRSTTLLMLTDGDTVPPMGMPRTPASVGHTVIVGVGDPRRGKFINGQNSRQDASTLRQVAARMGGVYHNGNELHMSTDLIRAISEDAAKSELEKLGRREWALIACICGGLTLALLPLLLHYFGTGWQPGAQTARSPNKQQRIQADSRNYPAQKPAESTV